MVISYDPLTSVVNWCETHWLQNAQDIMIDKDYPKPYFLVLVYIDIQSYKHVYNCVKVIADEGNINNYLNLCRQVVRWGY